MKLDRAQGIALFAALGFPGAETWKDDRLLTKVGKLPTLVNDKDKAKVKDKKLRALLDELITAVEGEEEITIKGAKAATKGKAAEAKPAKKASKKAAAEEDEDDEEEDDDDSGDEDDSEIDNDEEEEEADEDEDDEEEVVEDSDVEEDEEEEPAPKKKSKKSKKSKAKAAEEDDDEDADEDDSEIEDESDEDEDEDSDDEEDEEDEEVETTKSKKKKKAGKSDEGGNGKPSKKKKVKGTGVIASIAEFLSKASSKKPITKKALWEKLKKRFPDRAEDSMWSTINIQVPNRLKVDKGVIVSKNENGYWVDPAKNRKALKAMGVKQDEA